MPLNLAKIRRARGMSQLQVAKKSGVSRSYVNEIENNKYDPSNIITKLCKALKCTPNDLIKIDWEVKEIDRE